MATTLPTDLSVATLSSSSSSSRSFTNKLSRPPSAMALSLSGRRLASFPEFRIQTSSSKLGFPRISRRGGFFCQAQSTALDVASVTDVTFRSLVLKADGPVVVEFWAPWCGPCRVIHPVIAELAAEYAGKLKFFRLNTDESPSIATKYGVRSIPTIMIFVNGEKKDSVLGALPKTTLSATIEKFL